MELQEINDKLHKLGNAWESFKETNDLRLKEIEKRGAADPLLEEKLSKINSFMDSTKETIESVKTKASEIEAAVARSLKGGDNTGEKDSPDVESYRKGFVSYLRKGVVEGLDALQLKALSVGSDPDGGFTVTPQMSSTIVKVIQEYSPLRALASVETISSDALEILNDTITATSGWTQETGTRSDTDSPTIGKKNIPVNEMYAQPKATQKLLDDSAINIEQWLASKIAESFAIREGTAFVSGNGVGQPRGFLTYSHGTSWGTIEQVNSGSSGAPTADGILSLVYALKEGYTRGASFLMKRATTGLVRKLKENTTNAYIWQPGLKGGQPDTLAGFPSYEAVDMPAAAADSLSIAFANWKQAYQIVDRIGIRTLRDPYTDKPFVKFYTTKRVGGDVINFEAIKLQKLAS